MRTVVGRTCCEVVLFASLAVAATYPLVKLAGTHLPQGSERTATVPLLNCWTIWWNTDRLSQGYQGYWDAPIYHPVSGMLAATEPQTVVGWLAWPLVQLMPEGGGQVYNALVLLFLALNGWLACRFLRYLRIHWGLALSGGAMVCLLPIVHWQLGVFQLISVWGVIWTVMALIRFRRRPGFGTALHLALAFATTYSLCCYFGLFLSTLLLASAPVLLGRRLFSARTWIWGGVTILCASALLAPVVGTQLRFAGEHAFQYPEQWIRDLSASPADYLHAPGPQLVTLPDVRANDRFAWPLSPGTLKIAMACCGLALGLMNRRRRHVVLFLAVMAAVAFLLSLGPHLHWGNFSLHQLLVDYYPGFAQVRSLLRFAFFLQLAVALLATIGLYELLLMARKRIGRRLAGGVAILLGVTLACEAWPATPPLFELPEARQGWVASLEDLTQQPVCLACLPLPVGYTEEDAEPAAIWMYHQTRHGQLMVNGYSTFVPLEFQELTDELSEFPDQRGLMALQEKGVTHLVLDKNVAPQLNGSELKTLGLERIFIDREAGIQVWQLP